MLDKKKIKGYIRLYKKVIKRGTFHGAAGYSESDDGSITDLEVAARYLSIKGYPILVDSEIKNDRRKCYVAITE